MYIRFKRALARFFASAVVISSSAAMYAQISVVTVVTPPYTSSFSQYAEKVKVTVISPVAGGLRLSMTIKGDNGIVLQTIETGTTPIPANQPFQVPEDYLYEFFDPGSLNINGISSAELSEKGFPAGTYQICFNATISGNASFTGQSCNMFKVALAQPPRIIQPLCGSDQYKGGIQNILISWAPAMGAPRWTNYTLRIVEIRDSLLSPSQALRSGTRPSFFEEEVTGTSYLYGPKDPPLEKGCRYAFEIIAMDQETNTRFENGGRSEMCWFKYGKDDDGFKVNIPPASNITGPKTDDKKPVITPKDPFAGAAFSPANVSGTLYYQYAGPKLPSQSVTSLTPNTVIPSPQSSSDKAGTRTIHYGGKDLQFKTTPAISTNNAKGKLAGSLKDSHIHDLSFYSIDLRDPSCSYILKNTPVSLVVKYFVYDVTTKKTRMLSAYDINVGSLGTSKLITLKPDQVVASGYTDSQGRFDFTFFLPDSLGLVSSDISFYTGSGEFKTKYQGKLFRVLRLMVGSQHYCSPAQDIVVQPGESSTYDDLYSLVRSYGLTVKSKAQASPNNFADGAIEGLDVYILRQNKITDVPENEGYPDLGLVTNPVLPGYTAIAHAKTKQDGSATFYNMVKNVGGYDKYCVYINSESSQTFNYASRLVEFSNTLYYSGSGYITIPENAVFNNEYKYKDDYSTELELYALSPKIYGEVKLKSGSGQPDAGTRLADNAKVTLKAGFSVFSGVEGISTTDAEGKYSFAASQANGNISYTVVAEKDGYKTVSKSLNNGLPIKNGQKVYAGTLFLETKAVFSGKIIDVDSGEGVRCHVSVQNGLTVYSSDPSIINKTIANAGNSLSQEDIKCIDTRFVSLNLGSMKSVSATFTSESAAMPSMADSRHNKNHISVTDANKTVSGKITSLNHGPSYFALPAPSGTQTIIIAPDDNTNYFGDTLTVNLAEGNNVCSVTLSRKIHRIRLTVSVEGSGQNNNSNPGSGVLGNNSNSSLPGKEATFKGSRDSSTALQKSGGKNSQSESNQGKLGERQNTSLKNGKTSRSDLQSMINNQDFYIVAGARVRVVGRTDYVLTDDRGVAFLEFDGSDNFDIEVIPPKERDLESATRSYVGLSASRNYVEKAISLKLAAQVSGYVTFNGQGVGGATVKLNYPGKEAEAITADDGSYVLHNIPIENNIDISATKEKYIGATQTCDIGQEGRADVNFELTQSNEMDFSKMLGFEIAVTKVENTGDKTYISGSFMNIPRNGQIETEEEGQELSFTGLEVTKSIVKGESGLPYPVPVESSFKTNENEAVLKLNDTFTGRLESDNKGIEIAKGTGDNSGFIKGKVSVNTDISFQTNAVVFNSEKLYIKPSVSDQSPQAFNVIASDGAKLFADGVLPLFNQNGKSINYTLYGFKSEAKAGTSRIDGNKVKFNTILHTNLQNTGTADLAVELGDVNLTKQGVEPVSGSTAINMPLEQWTLKATKWSLNNNGFKLNEGEVVTHMANVSFTNMEIEPDALKYGTFDLNQLNIRGLTTLMVTGNASLFYQAGHWNLAIVPIGASCGYINPLPGMAPGTRLNVTSVSLKSNKTGTFEVDTDPFMLYGLVDFNPTSLAVYDDRIEFPGTINLNIPDVAERSSLIKYKKSGSEVKLFLQPYSFNFSTRGVDLAFSLDEKSLSSSGLTAKGTLSEPGLYSVNVQLNKNITKTEIIDIPGQTFPIDKSGNRKLSGFDGEMHIESDHWTNFIFSGDLTGTNGVSGRLTFIVNGDITAEAQSVKVEKIPTPFGDLKLTYDFDKGRIIGLLEIDQNLAGTGYVKGSAESVIDADGWYFCAGGKITMKGNPFIKNASTAMLFGDYPSLNDPFITKTFSDFSYTHSLPKAFQGHISGFYIDGAAEFPIPYVPNIDIDLVVVSGHASVSAGGDFSLGMNFSDAGNTYYTGSAVFVNASVGVGGSIGIACAGASFGANVELAQKGELNSNGDWFLEGTSTLTLAGSAYAGFGCCDSDCDGYWVCPCVSDSWSGNVLLQFIAHMGSDDNYFKINW